MSFWDKVKSTATDVYRGTVVPATQAVYDPFNLTGHAGTQPLIDSVKSGLKHLTTLPGAQATKDAAQASDTAAAAAAGEKQKQTMSEGQDLIKSLYGPNTQNIGNEAQNFSNIVKSGLNRDYAGTDVMRSRAAQQMGASQTRAGLSGLDMSGALAQEQRRSAMEAAAMNQDYRAKALALYGGNIGAQQRGVAGIDMGFKGLQNAQQYVPQQNYNSGSLFGLIG